MIAGIVSYFICWTVRLGLDWVEQKTGGRLGGHHTVHEDVQAYAHNPPKQATLPTKSSATSSDPEDSAHMKVSSCIPCPFLEDQEVLASSGLMGSCSCVDKDLGGHASCRLCPPRAAPPARIPRTQPT